MSPLIPGIDPELVRHLWKVSPAATAATLSQDDPVPWVPAAHLQLISNTIRNAVLGFGPKFNIISAPPRHGKPGSVNVLVLMGDGSRKRLGDIQVGDDVITKQGRARKVTEVFQQGTLPILKITSESGRRTRVAPDHPFWTTRGWIQAQDLKVGDYLANVSKPMTQGKSPRSLEEFRLAGYLVGDGCVASHHSGLAAGFTCFDDTQAQDFISCVQSLGFVAELKRPGQYQMRGGIRPWLRETGIGGHKSHTKTVPQWVFSADDNQVANFIGAYFACDGSINARGKKRKDACVEFYSVSEELLRGIQHLLLRFGVQSNLRNKKGRYKGEVHHSGRLAITSQDNVARFIGQIPVPGVKAEKLKEWGHTRATFDHSNELLPDKLACIQQDGEDECRCLTVEEDHSFTMDDFVVHNSWMISKWAPVWFLENWPEKFVMLCGYGATFAAEWGMHVRNSIANKQDWLSFFLSEDSKARHNWRTNMGGGMRTAGVGGDITGKGANCFCAGTKITTEFGSVDIVDLVGNSVTKLPRVLSVDHRTGKVAWSRIIAHKRSISRDIWEVATTAGRRLRLTGEQPIFVFGRGYTFANDLEPQDGIVGVIGSDTVSMVRQLRDEEVPVYDLQVEGTNNFFADGILAHNCLIVDDPIKNAEEANSFANRDALWEWWSSTARTRLEPGGVIIVLATRWHEDDLLGRLTNPEYSSMAHLWNVINLPAIYDEKAMKAGPDPLDRKLGEALWPSRWPVSELEIIKGTVSPEDWESLYQGRPARQSGKGTAYDGYSVENVRPVERNVDLPLCWGLDFNRNPMSSVIGQYQEELTPFSHLTNERLLYLDILQEMALPNSSTEEACLEFIKRTEKYVKAARGRRLRLEIYGDASGHQSHTTSGDETDWIQVRRFFSTQPQFAVTYRLTRDNPTVKARINSVNAALKAANGARRLTIDPSCRELRKDFEEVKWKRDVGGNTLAVLDKSDFRRTHISDALGYLVYGKFALRSEAGEMPGMMR